MKAVCLIIRCNSPAFLKAAGTSELHDNISGNLQPSWGCLLVVLPALQLLVLGDFHHSFEKQGLDNVAVHARQPGLHVLLWPEEPIRLLT